jgi:hypothetical protein
VVLAHPVEVDEFTVEIVQYFNLRGLLVKEHLSAPRECLHVCGVLWEESNELIRDGALTANVG